MTEAILSAGEIIATLTAAGIMQFAMACAAAAGAFA